MLVTQEPVLRRFWYPVMPIVDLIDGPQSFTLLGEPLVLWLTAEGEPAALRDRCCHRSAKLSMGIVQEGCVRCPYHGWAYDKSGSCTKVPQLDPGAAIPKAYRVEAFHCAERYGYAWVCLADDPLLPLPEIPEADAPENRLIPQFYEPWQCSGLRVMENSFDNAHFSIVHAESFGVTEQPKPVKSELVPLDLGLKAYATVPVVNPPLQQQLLNIPDSLTLRDIESTWYVPFSRTLKITYPNGLMHLIFTAATPVGDRTSQIVQFCVRNDSEADASAEAIVAFDRQVVDEDKVVLESTDSDTPVDVAAEQHMPSDQPGIIMRRQLAALIKAHGSAQDKAHILAEV
ncbi:aromatic ring-hydroxylating dioxygenase subunit alpha [Leptolyngbya sp. CCNP1308]|uniref:aromatic ring-hydroxylating dioxygenase subunit alpha n=1 Tax=Leptolyngbya sp. CCNP1308 TaxID=3110255 RepID=UPI002B217C71|nr:aromatic ring-hydroxylating dioxygenase subunit alpha [Leptolyngbya sp. CCNP1308]MEA5449886.1 aromatic ring-hydroxylating dioxygenase subunit alpha [Leptolyngbya sp. CCNP1308]